MILCTVSSTTISISINSTTVSITLNLVYHMVVRVRRDELQWLELSSSMILWSITTVIFNTTYCIIVSGTRITALWYYCALRERLQKQNKLHNRGTGSVVGQVPCGTFTGSTHVGTSCAEKKYNWYIAAPGMATYKCKYTLHFVGFLHARPHAIPTIIS